MAKARYSKPSSEVFAESVASGKYDDAAHSRINRGDDAVLSDDGFIGVDPEYRNFADPIHKPYQGDGKIGSELEATFLTDDADNDKGATAEGESDPGPGEDEDEDEGTGGGGSTPPTSPPPPAS